MSRLGRCVLDDSGHATVASAGIIAALTGLLLVVAGACSQVIAASRAQVAADLSAVAAAWEVALGGKDACAVADELASLNAARIDRCSPEPGGDVVVTAVVRGREATARAGPAAG